MAVNTQSLSLRTLQENYTGPDEHPREGTTTLMIRSIPRCYTEAALIEEMKPAVGSESFDFLYMPEDAQRDSNISYAFVNFLSEETMRRCFYALSGRNWRFVKTSKCCRIVSAHVQGLSENLMHYAQIASPQEGKRHSPIVVLGGVRVNIAEALERCVTSEQMQQMRDARLLTPSMDYEFQKRSEQKQQDKKKKAAPPLVESYLMMQEPVAPKRQQATCDIHGAPNQRAQAGFAYIPYDYESYQAHEFQPILGTPALQARNVFQNDVGSMRRFGSARRLEASHQLLEAEQASCVWLL